MNKVLRLLAASAFCALMLHAAEPTVYFSFDRSSRADFGGTGSGTGVTGATEDHGVIGQITRGTDTTPDKYLDAGISGKALRVGNSRDGKAIQNYRYNLQPGISSAQGAVSLWIKANDWNPAKSLNFHHFVSGSSKTERLIIYKYCENTRLVALLGPLSKGHASAKADISTWKTDTWHHICATWDAKILEIYMDGNKVDEAPRTAAPGATDFNNLQFSEYWTGNPGSSSVDEVRIYNRRLTRDEVVADYMLNAKNAVGDSAAIVMNVAQSTPVIDGTIRSGEYAFSISGMNNTMNAPVQYSQKQAECMA
ncbi:MAG: LamG domain-containing protein, partial [Victivallales bacterium]|nr:LamG domain-containing protein [Victivallales bacterium]